MTDALQEQFDDLIETIRDATDDVARGKIPDLKTLESRVTKLCTAVTKAGAETASAMKAPMAEMILRLDELARDLTDYQEKLKEDGKL